MSETGGVEQGQDSLAGLVAFCAKLSELNMRDTTYILVLETSIRQVLAKVRGNHHIVTKADAEWVEEVLADGVMVAVEDGSPLSAGLKRIEIRYTAPTWPDRPRRAARSLGAQVEGADPADAGPIIADVIIALMKRLDVPNGLSAIGYTSADIPALVDGTDQVDVDAAGRHGSVVIQRGREDR